MPVLPRESTHKTRAFAHVRHQPRILGRLRTLDHLIDFGITRMFFGFGGSIITGLLVQVQHIGSLKSVPVSSFNYFIPDSNSLIFAFLHTFKKKGRTSENSSSPFKGCSQTRATNPRNDSHSSSCFFSSSSSSAIRWSSSITCFALGIKSFVFSVSPSMHFSSSSFSCILCSIAPPASKLILLFQRF